MRSLIPPRRQKLAKSKSRFVDKNLRPAVHRSPPIYPQAYSGSQAVAAAPGRIAERELAVRWWRLHQLPSSVEFFFQQVAHGVQDDQLEHLTDGSALAVGDEFEGLFQVGMHAQRGPVFPETFGLWRRRILDHVCRLRCSVTP